MSDDFKRIFVIPDTQVRPDLPPEHLEHFDWIGRAITKYLPDVVVHLGDHHDMPSLSSHAEPGSLEKEGARIKADLDAGNDAWHRMFAGMWKEIARRRQGHRRRWEPRLIRLLGNHENRIDRAVNADPRLQGTLSTDLLLSPGFEVVPFLTVIEEAGILFSHYFVQQQSGRPLSGSIDSRLNRIGASFCQGHQQGMLYGVRQMTGNRIQHGLVAGSCYLHDEVYRGPQANGEWRGVICLNEARNGGYDIMPLSMSYLKRKFS